MTSKKEPIFKKLFMYYKHWCILFTNVPSWLITVVLIIIFIMTYEENTILTITLGVISALSSIASMVFILLPLFDIDIFGYEISDKKHMGKRCRYILKEKGVINEYLSSMSNPKKEKKYYVYVSNGFCWIKTNFEANDLEEDFLTQKSEWKSKEKEKEKESYIL